ncbi:MAG TPA: DNA repair protein RecN [Verrucomicrobiae bacterium]|nr:DNA repair protein RecN [Verrucomicrobiae bacterium]
MLTTLRIKNLALVSDLTLELRPGYNVITGETGAGKSILIGALDLALGERADRGLIRAGSDGCAVEAVFDISDIRAPIKTFLEESGVEPCEENQLVLKRAVTAAGANRQFINGSPASLGTLARIGEWLVDIHGPHDHQSLLRPMRQLRLLDGFAKLDEQRESFSALLRARAELERRKAALIVDERTYAQQLDLLRFQAREISDARLDPAEEETLEREYARAGNLSKLLALGAEATGLLAENDDSLVARSGALGRVLQELRRLDASAAELLDSHEQAASALRELQSGLSHYVEKLELDPAALERLEERINLIQSLKRKYAATIQDVIDFGENAAQKLAALEQRDVEAARIDAELAASTAALRDAGKALTAQRRKAVSALNRAVTRELAQLGFKQSHFEATLASVDDATPGFNNTSGFDTVEFQFAPNPGEPLRPLRAIASSGELARVMLAIKTVLVAVDQIPVLVFDEVDANVGGETATVVGEKMRQIAKNRQVLCITHLPQVAAPAANHFVATKQTRAGRTVSQINLLENSERVAELARMLGGQTEAARRHAQAMLG